MPDKRPTQSIKRRHAFFTSISNGDFSNFLNGMLDNFSENKHKNQFNFTDENGKVKPENFHNLTNILNYLNEGLNTIKDLPFDKLKLVRELNSVIRKKAQNTYNHINQPGYESINEESYTNELFDLVFSSINVTHNAIKFAPPEDKRTFENDTIFAYLSREVKDFGNLTLDIRNQEYDPHSITTTVAALIKNTPANLTTDQEKQIRYDFISQFHRGMEDIENACQELLNTTDCYYPKSATDQYYGIKCGRFPLNTNNTLAVLDKFYNDTSIMKSNSFFHSEDEISNFLSYFSQYVNDKNTQHSGISVDFVDNMSVWIHTFHNDLQNIKPTLKIYNQLFFLIEKIIADPHFSSKKFFLLTTAINNCLDFMKELLETGNDNYDNTIDSFASLFHQINKKEQISIGYKSHYATELTQFGLICLQNKPCNANLLLKKFTEIFGKLAKNIGASEINPSKIEIEKIEEMVQQLLKNATDKISESELKEIAISFIKQYSSEAQIAEKCASLFNLTGCNPIISMPTSLASNTTEINLRNDNVTNELDDGLTNSTHSEIIESNNPLSLASKIGTAMGIGAFAGGLNGASQIILHIAEQKNCSLNTQRLLAVTLAIANSFAISTLPLIYSIVENLANEETDSLVNSQKLLTCTYAFITSMALQSIHAVTHYVLPKKSILKNLFNMLPLFAGLWMLANGEEDTIESLAILATHILTSMAGSSLTYFSLNRLVSAKNQQRLDIETLYTKVNYYVKNNDVELLQPLQKEKTSESEAIKKTYQYICLPELDEVKKLSKNNLDQLKNIIKTLQNNIDNLKQQKEVANTSGILNALSKSIKDNSHILDILITQFKSAEILCNELADDMHLKACKMYTLTRKKDFVSAMEKLGNVFKLMEANFKTLQGKIDKVIGYTEAASENFSDEVKTQLSLLNQTIIFPLSKVTLYKDRYSNADAIEKTEKRCKAEANQGVFNVLIQADPSIIKRTHTNKEIFNANRNTFAFSRGSDSDLRISTASSSGESELSMTSGNSVHNPIAPQQIAPLLRSFRT